MSKNQFETPGSTNENPESNLERNLERREGEPNLENPIEKGNELIEQAKKFEKENLDKTRKVIKNDGKTETKFASSPLAEVYQRKIEELRPKQENNVFKRMFTAISSKVIDYLYKKYPEVKESNDPNNENYFLKRVDRYNQNQEGRAHELGFEKKIAFLGHMHSRGVDDWRDGSDGSLTPEEIMNEYRKAVKELKEQGYNEVYATLTDHNAIGNSLKVAEMMQKEGIAKPIIGIEAASKQGYEVLGYTTDIEKMKEFYGFMKPKLGSLLRFAKSGHDGKKIIAKMKEAGFVMGLPHPTANKAIIFGGTTPERMKRDPEFAKLLSENMLFYEALNWFQNTKGSNCLAVNMMEMMEEMGVMSFSNEDFHSKVAGSKKTFFNGMFTEIRTNQDIASGEDLLKLFQAQKKNPKNPKFVSLLRGTPATDNQYKEHLNNATSRTIRCILKGLVGAK